MGKAKSSSLEELTAALAALSSKTDQASADDPKYSLDDLKAVLDKDELTHDDVVALTRHITKHVDRDTITITSCCISDKDDGTYRASGVVAGDPGMCSMGVMTLLKKALASV